MTYESASEAEVLKSYWRPGVALENTLFVFLDPYGRQLTQGTRTPGHLYSDAHDMAIGLDDIAKRYSGRGENQNLPVVATVRLALNVAAADKLPLAIVVGDSSQDRRAMEKKLAPLSWRSDLIGKLTYTSGAKNELTAVSGGSVSRGYVFVEPNEFGTGGQVLAQLNASATTQELERTLQQTISSHRASNSSHEEHVHQGQMAGIGWTTAIPITDPGTLAHEQRTSGGGYGGEGGGGGGGGSSGGGFRPGPREGGGTQGGPRPNNGQGQGPGQGPGQGLRIWQRP
ncbi:hypothetical protein BH11CYA1_BH11CYA1_12770 [soil metagenome]